MVIVYAGQHIYTNVEKEQSPHHRSGYQTLFYTHVALSEAESDEIEAHVPYYRSEGEPIKRVFFSTSTGKRVVAHIVPLADTDRHGRQGRYLAHSLAFTPEAFTHLKADPFWVLRHFPCITTVEEALRHGNVQMGDISAVSFESPAEPVQDTAAAQYWSAQELQKLVLLALRADQLAQHRQAVAIVGAPQQVEHALEAAFFAVPTPLRPHCTFDTYFYKCNFVATSYWAIGELEPPSNPIYSLVEARSRQVMSLNAGQPQTAYERWVVQALEHNDLDAIASCRDQAFALCAWLEGNVDAVAVVDSTVPEAIVSVFQVNAQQVQALLHVRLGEQLPSTLVERIFASIYHHTEAVDLFRYMQEEFALPQLLDVLYRVYTTLGFQAPQRAELQALGTVLQRTAHRALGLLHACWTGQHQILRQRLEELSEEDYRQFVQTALHYDIGEPLTCLIPGRGDVFLDLYLAFNANRDQDLIAVVQAVLATGEASHLSRLIPYIPEQSARTLRTIAKILSRRADIPESFRWAVHNAITALPPEKGWRGLLRALLGPHRGKSKDNNGISC